MSAARGPLADGKDAKEDFFKDFDPWSFISSLHDPSELTVLENPQLADDGFTYSLATLNQWRKQCRALNKPFSSPMTNNPISDSYRYNQTVKSIIDEYKEKIVPIVQEWHVLRKQVQEYKEIFDIAKKEREKIAAAVKKTSSDIQILDNEIKKLQAENVQLKKELMDANRKKGMSQERLTTFLHSLIGQIQIFIFNNPDLLSNSPSPPQHASRITELLSDGEEEELPPSPRGQTVDIKTVSIFAPKPPQKSPTAAATAASSASIKVSKTKSSSTY